MGRAHPIARRSSRLVPIVVAIVVWAACHSGRAPAAVVAAAAIDTTVHGTVSVVGSAPDMAVVLRSAGDRYEIVGDLEGEVATLGGATVDVTGALITGPLPLGTGRFALDVRRYTIDSIAGGVPVVGVLRRSGDHVAIGDRTLTNVPDELRRWAGAKVWVVGKAGRGQALSVETFGVLRQAPRPSGDQP